MAQQTTFVKEDSVTIRFSDAKAKKTEAEKHF